MGLSDLNFSRLSRQGGSRGCLAALLPALLVYLAAAPLRAGAVDSCTDCHKDEKYRIQNKKIYDYFLEWSGSPHDIAGLACTSCHGGVPGRAAKEEAHRGILPQSDALSSVHYKNIPKTCGKCHSSILERYSKSRHYEILESSGKGPSCITCHGSLNARTYYTTIIGRACSTCHNEETGNHPEIIPYAKDILNRLNHANGYRKGLAFYYESINKPRAMEKVNAAYTKVVRAWHEFNFEQLDQRSKDLVTELKAIYVEAQKERNARENKQGK